MIRNSDVFFTRAKEYQDKRKDIMDVYEKRVEQLEDAKGSKYYNDEIKRAKKIKDDDISELKNEYTTYFRLSLEAMNKANHNRTMKAPTEEELRLLQMLKLKDKLSDNELEAAANALKGNAACLSVLSDIAHAQGKLRDYLSYSDSNELPFDAVESTLRGIEYSLSDFLDYDTSKAARETRKHFEGKYGAIPDAPALPKRALFDNKEDCFRSFAAGLTGNTLNAFCNAVDG